MVGRQPSKLIYTGSIPVPRSTLPRESRRARAEISPLDLSNALPVFVVLRLARFS